MATENTSSGGGKKAPQPSLRGAINAFCKQCLYDPLGGVGNWRQQITACTASECALYAVRPLSKSA